MHNAGVGRGQLSRVELHGDLELGVANRSRARRLIGRHALRTLPSISAEPEPALRQWLSPERSCGKVCWKHSSASKALEHGVYQLDDYASSSR